MGDPSSLQKIKDEIGHVESRGNYSAVNSQKGSTATGKYQFIYRIWKDQIAEVTGMKSRQQFLDSPVAQEKFMDHYTNHVLIPRVQLLRQEGIGQKYSDADIAKTIHLLGAAGAARKLSDGSMDVAVGHNLTPNQYIAVSNGGTHPGIGSNNKLGSYNSLAPDPNQNPKAGQQVSHPVLQDDDDDDEPQTNRQSIYDQVRQAVNNKYNGNYADGSTIVDPIDPIDDPNSLSAQLKNGNVDRQIPNSTDINPIKTVAAPNQLSSTSINQPALNPSESSTISKGLEGKETAAGAAAISTGVLGMLPGILQDDQAERTGVVDKGLAVGKGALTGGLAGATAGAGIGTAILPGVGTAIGAAVGGGAGAITGAVTGLVGANREQKSITGAAIKRGQSKDAAINNRAVTTDYNPYGTQMRDGGFPNIFKFDEGSFTDGSTSANQPESESAFPVSNFNSSFNKPTPSPAIPFSSTASNHEQYSANFMNIVNKYAGTNSRESSGIMSLAPQLNHTYNQMNEVAKHNPDMSGQFTRDKHGVLSAASCASVGNTAGYASGDHLGVSYDPDQLKKGRKVDLSNRGQGMPGTGSTYYAMLADKNRKTINYKNAQPGDAIFFFDEDGHPNHMQRSMPDNTAHIGNTNKTQKVGRGFDDDGYGNTHVSVYPEFPKQYKLQKGEHLGSMTYDQRQQLFNGRGHGEYSRASTIQRQDWSNNKATAQHHSQAAQSLSQPAAQPAALPPPPPQIHYQRGERKIKSLDMTHQELGHRPVEAPGTMYQPGEEPRVMMDGAYEDGSTVQGLAQIPAQAIPQDVSPMQPATKGQPQGQPQQNMIDIEKGELRIDPKSGKILQQYTGINPTSGTRYQRHNNNPDGEPAGNFVPADPGQFIVTVKDAKNFKNADINNDTITKGTIMRNIINNKDKKQTGNYRQGSYVVPELPRFDGGGTTGDPDPRDAYKHLNAQQRANLNGGHYSNEAPKSFGDYRSQPAYQGKQEQLVTPARATPVPVKHLAAPHKETVEEEYKRKDGNPDLPNNWSSKNTSQRANWVKDNIHLFESSSKPNDENQTFKNVHTWDKLNNTHLSDVLNQYGQDNKKNSLTKTNANWSGGSSHTDTPSQIAGTNRSQGQSVPAGQPYLNVGDYIPKKGADPVSPTATTKNPAKVNSKTEPELTDYQKDQIEKQAQRKGYAQTVANINDFTHEYGTNLHNFLSSRGFATDKELIGNLTPPPTLPNYDPAVNKSKYDLTKEQQRQYEIDAHNNANKLVHMRFGDVGHNAVEFANNHLLMSLPEEEASTVQNKNQTPFDVNKLIPQSITPAFNPVSPTSNPVSSTPLHPGQVAVTAANKKAIAKALPTNRTAAGSSYRPEMLNGEGNGIDYSTNDIPYTHIQNANNYENQQLSQGFKSTAQPEAQVTNNQTKSPIQNKQSMMNSIGRGLSDYGPSLYNIGQGFRVEHEGHIASDYNPNEGNILGNMGQTMNYEPQRQEALRNADAQGNDIDQRTNSSSVGRSNKNNVYTNTMNTLANTRMQNAEYNNKINESRAAVYNNLGEQRVAADQYSSKYNTEIDQINAQNRGAAANSIGTGLGQMQQVGQNNRKVASEASNDQYMMNTILPSIYPSLKEYPNLRPPSNN